MQKEAIEKLKEILWKTNGITSYKLLALYIESSEKYDKPEKFEKLLGELKIQKDIVYSKESDQFTLYKKINIDITVSSESIKRNCYDCPFRLKEDREDLNDTSKTELTCALDVSLHPHNSMDGLDKIECPLNKAWTVIKENNN